MPTPSVSPYIFLEMHVCNVFTMYVCNCAGAHEAAVNASTSACRACLHACVSPHFSVGETVASLRVRSSDTVAELCRRLAQDAGQTPLEMHSNLCHALSSMEHVAMQYTHTCQAKLGFRPPGAPRQNLRVPGRDWRGWAHVAVGMGLVGKLTHIVYTLYLCLYIYIYRYTGMRFTCIHTCTYMNKVWGGIAAAAF